MAFWRDNHNQDNNFEFQEYIDSPDLSSASLDGSEFGSESVAEHVNSKQNYHTGFSEDLIPNGQSTNYVDSTHDAQFLSKNLFLKSNEPLCYSIVHSINPSNGKNGNKEKNCENEKAHSSEEAVQASTQELETLRKPGLSFEDVPPALDASFTSEISFVSLSQVPSGSPSASLISEEEILFKKREIKCKNIRRSEILIKKSVSPVKEKERSQDRHAREKHKRNRYPKNWLEYKEMKLNPKRDALVKSKEFKSFENKKFDFKGYFNFDKRPIPTDSYRYQNCNGNYENLPFQYLRYTAAKPQVLYSTNHMHTSPTPLNREQIFAIIPRERISIIQKLWKYSCFEPVNGAPTVKAWYPKKWKNLDSSEAKLLENSVGLSFLQSYSDEEEHVDQEPLAIVEVAAETQSQDTPDNLEGIITVSKSRWDLAPPEKQQSEPAIKEVKTPPLAKPKLNEREEGEVSEDEHTPQTPELSKGLSEGDSKEKTVPSVDPDLEEYERTKEELFELEKVLKSSTSYLEELNTNEGEEVELKKKEKKKKRKKAAVVKVSRRKDPKKKIKKKKKKDEPAESSEVDSAEETSTKKERKDKHKDKKRKIKKKKKNLKPESHSKEKRKKKKNLTEKSRRRTISGESDLKDYKPEEDYEDDIKFFAERLHAERELKGRSKHKTKGIHISVDELRVTKSEEKISKRKLSESDEARSKSKDKESSKKEEVKVDLLKMNEKYLRQQKKKEELTPKEKTRDSRSLSSEKSKGKVKPEKSNAEHSSEKVLHKAEELIIISKEIEEAYPDCEQSKEKWKRARTDSTSQESTEKKAKPAEELMEIIRPEEVSIKQEKHFSQTNSWEESDEESIEINQSDSPNLEMPFEIQHVPRKEIKIEKDLFDIEEPPSKVKKCVEKTATIDDQPDLRLHLLEIKSRKSEAAGLEVSALAPQKKKRRWDIQSPAIIPEPSKDIVTLEDKYEEFMKAVTVKTEDDKKNIQLFVIDSSSESSVTFLEDLPANESLQDIPPVEIPLPPLSSNETKLVFVPPSKVETIPPLKCDKIKLVPVPPPKLEALPSLKSEEVKVALLPLAKEEALPPLKSDEIKLAFVPPPKVEALPPLKSDEIKLAFVSPPKVEMLPSFNNEVVKLVPVPTPHAATGVEFHPVPVPLPKIKTSPSLKTVPVLKDVEFKPVPVPSPKVEPPPAHPLKTDEFKPVVPSPKLEAVLDLNKPLINLSLSANVTQNITFSLATSMPSISAPITSTIDVSKPKVEISTLPTETYYVPNPYFTPEIFQLPPPPPPPPEEPNTKMIFTSIALPSKKLLDNSQLNLDDSDGDDVKKLEMAKRKRLEALMAENQQETDKEQARMDTIINKIQEKSAREGDKFRRSSPRRSSASSRHRDPSPRRGEKKGRRESPVRRRGSSPRRRSPVRKRSPRRSSPRRRSPARKKSSGRRSVSPKRRRSTASPRKRRSSPSPKRKRSQSPRKSKPRLEAEKVRHEGSKKSRDVSPLQRRVPDSTISDDQLSRENYLRFPEPEFLNFQAHKSPKREPLDIRINQALEYDEPRGETSPKPISTITTAFYHNSESYHQGGTSLVESPLKRNIPPTLRTVENQGMYRQVGNIMQIVPMEQDSVNANPVPISGKNVGLEQEWYQQFDNLKPPSSHLPEPRPQILQVGNVLEVVPTEIMSGPTLLQQIKTEIVEDTWYEQPLSPDKRSAEATMLQKEAERREERERRRLERDRRRVEKERRRQEKEKARQAKTEDMIRKALEEEEEENERVDFVKNEIVQWPPLPLLVHHTVNNDAGRSILVNSGSRLNEIPHVDEKIRKVVQFADGVRPGYGTSPSAGEELSSPKSSPPPKRKLPKEKRYNKLKFHKKNLKKKKVKVKVLRKPLEESDSDGNLPPPSPPPGSPPPHVYPPRVKSNVINNVPTAYLASIMQTVQQLQAPSPSQLNIYRQPPQAVNLLMPPPPLSHVPPQSHVQSPSLAHVPSTHVPPPHLQSPHVPPPRLQSPHGTPLHTGHSPQGPYSHHIGLPPPPSPVLQSTTKTSRWSSETSKW